MNGPSRQARAGWVSLFVLLGCALIALGCFPKNTTTAVVYAAQDQVYAEPILQQFGRENQFRVRPLYDSEAVKTVGLANRLLAEQAYPQCDLFWNNEELRTRQLAARGLWRSNSWAHFGYRSRRLVINTNRLTAAQAPRTLQDLTNQTWRGQVVVSYPLLGSTATHFLALRQHWGTVAWTQWCRGLVANQTKIVDGNSLVVQLVGRGEALLGLTDSDDIAAGQRNGWPVAALPLTPEMLLIPNTIAVSAQAPHPGAAQQLFLYLQQPGVAATLVAAGALEGSTLPEDSAATLQVDWNQVLADLEIASRELGQIFLR